MESLKGFIEVLKQIKHKGPQPKFCPVCKGHRIHTIATFGILPPKYHCEDCGYKGAIILEIEPED